MSGQYNLIDTDLSLKFNNRLRLVKSRSFLHHESIRVSGLSSTIRSSARTGGKGGVSGKTSSILSLVDSLSIRASSIVDNGFIDCDLA